MHHIEVVSQLEARHLELLPPLLAAAARADGHEPLGEHKFLRLRRGDDLATALLAFERGTLAGYAHALTYGDGDDRRTSCELVVDPTMRRHGVGASLIAAVVEGALVKGARRLDLWAYNDNDASQQIAARFGFEPTRRLLHLHRHMESVPTAERPAGATLRTLLTGVDDESLLALNNQTFAGHPENGRWTLEDLRARMAQPWFDAGDVLLPDVDGALAGFCWLKVEDRSGEGRIGEIYVIGAAPAFQGRGLGRYLLASALGRLRARDATAAAIYVDQTNDAAVGLYTSDGFHYHHVDVRYTRALAEDRLDPDLDAAEMSVVAA